MSAAIPAPKRALEEVTTDGKTILKQTERCARVLFQPGALPKDAVTNIS
jgi:hypothetical protein